MSKVEYWQTDDKAWMKARKEEWKNTFHNLKAINKTQKYFVAKNNKHHKELFLYGTINDEPLMIEGKINPYFKFIMDHPTCLAEILNGYWVFFFIWYHPCPEKLDIDYFRLAHLQFSGFYNARDFIDSAVSRWAFKRTSRRDPPLLKSDYGIMNGREKYVMELLYGKNYSNEKFVVESWDDRYKYDDRFYKHSIDYTLDTSSSFIIDTVITGTKCELIRDARYIPYNFGQYLWQHVSDVLGLFHDEIKSNNYPDLDNIPAKYKLRFKPFVRNLVEILDFENRKDTSRNRPSTIDLVNQVTTMIDKKSASEPLLNLWKYAKENFHTLIKEDTTHYYGTMDQIKWPKDIQEQRVTSWKQIEDYE